MAVDFKSDDSESHTCSKCGRRFSLAHHFKRHVQTCTSAKTCRSAKTKTRRTFGSFPCKTCGKVFSRSDWLRRHQEVHSKERPFKCKLCSASYKRRDALQRHELIQHTWPDEQVKKSAASEARCVKCGKVYMAGEIPRHMAMCHSVEEKAENNHGQTFSKTKLMSQRRKVQI
ncbi:zinc finger protein 519-like [Branchiostoma floridae]|uniref:Zinc finger protein 519-like n=1 Tax=Branchiostoma floridae TaxID=7739 RepID=A0A9J7HJA3_BRAFL|nr:zinc finger protein 519-like [Branchiostoma floridae]